MSRVIAIANQKGGVSKQHFTYVGDSMAKKDTKLENLSKTVKIEKINRLQSG